MSLLDIPRDHPIWTWIAILVVIFLLSLFKVTPTNEEANGVPW